MNARDNARSLLTKEAAATASEYATILAVVAIAFIVSLNLLGRNVGRTVRNVDSRLGATGNLKETPAGAGRTSPNSQDSGGADPSAGFGGGKAGGGSAARGAEGNVAATAVHRRDPDGPFDSEQDLGPAGVLPQGPQHNPTTHPPREPGGP